MHKLPKVENDWTLQNEFVTVEEYRFIALNNYSDVTSR